MWSNMQGKGAMMYSTDIISSLVHAMLLSGLLLCAQVKGALHLPLKDSHLKALPQFTQYF